MSKPLGLTACMLWLQDQVAESVQGSTDGLLTAIVQQFKSPAGRDWLIGQMDLVGCRCSANRVADLAHHSHPINAKLRPLPTVLAPTRCRIWIATGASSEGCGGRGSEALGELLVAFSFDRRDNHHLGHPVGGRSDSPDLGRVSPEANSDHDRG